MPSSPSQRLAAEVLALLAGSGVEHVFLAPGARSQSLAIAAAQLADAEKLKKQLEEAGATVEVK